MYKSLYCCLLIVATIAALVNADSKPSTISAQGRVYDQLPRLNSNFEPESGSITRGIVKDRLSSKRIPELKGLTTQEYKDILKAGRIVDTSLFESSFFVSSPGINQQINYNLTLNYDSGRDIYVIDSQTFFPINNRGFDSDPNNRIYRDQYGNYQNFHFCMVSNMFFTYQGHEVFNFRGDDDVWVFINGQLAVDLGGLHSAETGNVNLQTFGFSPALVVGSTYSLDFFYCERHTTTSTLKMETNIQVFCATYDYCGQCNGDGSTCCNPATTCNDNNPCTVDKCPKVGTPGVTKDNVANFCTHETISCPNQKCFSQKCNVNNGKCERNTPLTCEKVPCKVATCSDTLGCQYEPLCSQDKCSPEQCQAGTDGGADKCNRLPDVNCTQTDKCKNYFCNPASGCYNTPKNCQNATDTNPCNQYSCNPATGCTVKTLSPTECQCCQTTPINKCQVGVCDSSTGKCNVKDNPALDDGDLCTIDKCFENNGTITHTPIKCSGCQTCKAGVCVNDDTTCNDGSLCTVDKCVTNSTTGVNSCAYSDTNCDDNDPCTVDLCDPIKGCYHEARVCPDEGSCNVGICIPGKGCGVTARNCSTGVFCTDAICIEGTGCVNFTRNCVGNDPKCKKGTCNIDKQQCEYSDYSPKPFGCNKAAIISTGVIAGIVVAGAVAVAIAAFGGKKGYDYWKNHRENKISGLNSNPLYTANPGAGTNPLYADAGN